MNAQTVAETGRLAAGIVLAVAMGLFLPRAFGDRMPQTAGEDVLALVLGDARLEVSRLFEDKADEYFHGGAKHLDCEMHEALSGEDHDDEHEHEHEHAHAALNAPVADPWHWINQQIHVQEHRHLKGQEMAELLPWFWAACRLSPENVSAYESGAYILSSMLHKPEEGIRLLEEGVRKNPLAPELDFSLGEIYFNKLHDAAKAEPCFAAARQKCESAACKNLSASDRDLLRLRALVYLGYIAKQRGDLDRVRIYLQEAETVDSNHIAVKDLRAMLNAAPAVQQHP
jgi:tetratricopeptide (TPR) repeat protein